MDQASILQNVVATEPDSVTGYRTFKLGGFEFSRDAYFVTVKWPRPDESARTRCTPTTSCAR